MENPILVILIIPLLFITVNGLNFAISKRRVRKEAEKNGWKIIKMRIDFKQTFLESFGPLNNLAFNVFYENNEGVIMNPNIYVGLWGAELKIEQDFPAAKNQKMNT